MKSAAIIEEIKHLSPDVFDNGGKTVIKHLFAEVERLESKKLPAARFNIVIAAIVFRDARRVGMPSIAICFNIDLSSRAIECEIKGVIASIGLNEFLSFGCQIQAPKLCPKQIFQRAVIIKIIDFDGIADLPPGCRNENQPPPAVARNGSGQLHNRAEH